MLGTVPAALVGGSQADEVDHRKTSLRVDSGLHRHPFLDRAANCASQRAPVVNRRLLVRPAQNQPIALLEGRNPVGTCGARR
jgi:hypothetical protein